MHSFVEWLVGGGAVGTRIRAHDWSLTSLGPRASWSPALRAVVNLVVDGHAPMALLWGRERLVLPNDAWVRSLDTQDVLGRSADALFPALEPVFAAAERGETARSAAVFVRAAAGGGLACSCSPVRVEDGTIGGVLMTLEDQAPTEEVEPCAREAELLLVHAELSEANARLREADRRKNEFLAMLSHELRNPLAPIRIGVHILEHTPAGGEAATRALSVIDRQARHMTRLVEDLLDLTRISRGKITLHRERLDLAALVRATAEDHREVFAKSGIALEVVLPPGRVWVDGDPTRLSQVVSNLLTNAVKFGAPSGATVLTVAREDDCAVVRVRDDGVGMSPKTLGSLFEPFVQAAQTLDRTRGGLGLGLALVKGIVDMHGGTVTAHSDGEGQGAELTVGLPALPAMRSDRPTPRESARPPRARRVLVVEDNVDAAESLRVALELGAHEVRIAHTGPLGLDAARRHKPDVILCDIRLPELDGYEVARALRADPDPEVRSAFLVALTGFALHEDVEKAKAAGFDRHMAKPPDMAALARAIAGITRLGS